MRSKLPAPGGMLPFALVLFSMLPTTILVPFQREIVEQHGGDPRSRALFVSLTMLGLFVLSPAAGFILDRIRQKNLVLAAFSFLNGASFLWILLSDSLESLLSARFFEGATFAFVIGPLMARAGAESEERGGRMAMAGLLLALGAALGMPLGGWLGNERTAILIACAVMAGVGLLSLYLQGDSQPSRNARRGEVRSLLLRAPLFLVPIGFAFLDRFLAGFLVGPFSWRLRTDLAMGPAEVGRLLGAVMLPMVLLAVPAAILARRVGPLPLVSVGSAVYGLSIAAAALCDSTITIAWLLILAGLGAGFLYAPSLILTSRMAPPDLKNTAMALYIGVGSLGFMLGPVIPAEFMRVTENPGRVIEWTASMAAALAVLTSGAAIVFRKRLATKAQT